MIIKRKRIFKIIILVIFLGVFIAYQYDNSMLPSITSNSSIDDNNSYTEVVNNLVTVNKNIKPTIVIDAGHGGIDTGAIGFKKTKEKDITLPVALKVGAILENNGIKVIYTRNSDKISLPANERKNLDARTQISNNNNANLFVSIHANSSIFKFVNGVETYYGNSSTSKKLAGLVENQIVKNNKMYDRGIKTANYYVLKNTKAPAILVELGFITNANDESIIGNFSKQQQLASSIANGILQYYKK